MRVTRVTCFARAIAIVVAIFISSGQFFFIAIRTKAADAKAKHRGLSNDQKITQLLTRLTFGIRPGDLEYVKAIGINEFITQQLNPESMKDSGLDERLRKLPTLTIGTPELIEQYTPPKATPSPSPQASMPVLPSPATATSLVEEQKGIVTPVLTTLSAEQQMKMEKTESQDSMMRNQVTVQAMKPAGGEAMKESRPSNKTASAKAGEESSIGCY